MKPDQTIPGDGRELGVYKKMEALWEASRSKLPWAGTFRSAYEIMVDQIPSRASIGLVADNKAFIFKLMIEVSGNGSIGRRIVPLVVKEQTRVGIAPIWTCENENTRWSICGRPFVQDSTFLECLLIGRCFKTHQDGCEIAFYLTDKNEVDEASLEAFVEMAL